MHCMQLTDEQKNIFFVVAWQPHYSTVIQTSADVAAYLAVHHYTFIIVFLGTEPQVTDRHRPPVLV